MEKTKTVVSIAGKEYTICGTDSAEYIHRVALKVNGKYEQLKKANPDLNNVQLAMLTCLNLADDLVKAQELKRGASPSRSRSRAERRIYKGNGARGACPFFICSALNGAGDQ